MLPGKSLSLPSNISRNYHYDLRLSLHFLRDRRGFYLDLDLGLDPQISPTRLWKFVTEQNSFHLPLYIFIWLNSFYKFQQVLVYVTENISYYVAWITKEKYSMNTIVWRSKPKWIVVTTIESFKWKSLREVKKFLHKYKVLSDQNLYIERYVCILNTIYKIKSESNNINLLPLSLLVFFCVI